MSCIYTIKAGYLGNYTWAFNCECKISGETLLAFVKFLQEKYGDVTVSLHPRTCIKEVK